MKWLACLSLIAAAVKGQIHVQNIATSSDFTQTLPAEGSLASIGVSGLTGITGVIPGGGFPLPYSLAGVSVTVNGVAAPILAIADLSAFYANVQQINIQVPQGAGGPGNVVQVSQNGQTAQATSGSVDSSNWSVFFSYGNEEGALQHADGSLVTIAAPAKPGEVLVAYATNLTSYTEVPNAPPIGMAAGADPLPSVDPSFVRSWQLQVNGEIAQIQYLGLTPGLAGVFQINFAVPPDISPGTAKVQMIVPPLCSGFAFCGLSFKSSHVVTFPVGPAG